jgi:hypothetical protein
MLITRLLVNRGNYRYCSFCSPFLDSKFVTFRSRQFDRNMKMALHACRVVYNSSFFVKCYMASFIVTCT